MTNKQQQQDTEPEENKSRVTFAIWLIFAALFVLLVASARQASGQEVVPIANGANWQTALVLTNRGPSAAAFSLSNCGYGPQPTITLAPGDAALLRDGSYVLCGGPFGALTLPSHVTGYAQLSFRDSASKSSFAVEPLTALPLTGFTRVGPVVQDGDLITTLTVLTADPVYITVRAPNATTFLIQPPVGQVRLALPFKAGFVEIGLGLFGVGPAPPPPDRPVYAFLTVGTPDAGNLRVVRVE